MKIVINDETKKTSTNAKASFRNSAKRTASTLKTIRNDRFVIRCLNEERNTLRLEKQIPELAKVATRQAFRRALALGSTVLIAEAGQLKEVFPNGTERVIRRIEPSVKMRKGQIIKIK